MAIADRRVNVARTRRRALGIGDQIPIMIVLTTHFHRKDKSGKYEFLNLTKRAKRYHDSPLDRPFFGSVDLGEWWRLAKEKALDVVEEEILRIHV